MANYFVKKTGNNGNNGTTWALAKQTISAALALASSVGDNVYVAPGVYNETLADPAGNGDANTRNMLVGDVDSTITDGDSNTSGVTAGPIKVIAQPNSSEGVIHWDTTNYWQVKNMWFEAIHSSNDYRAGYFGTYLNANYAKGMLIEDCYFIGNSYGAIFCPAPYVADSQFIVRRCFFYALNPTFICCKKTTTFSANPDIEFYYCVAHSEGTGNYGPFGGYGESAAYCNIDYHGCTAIVGTNTSSYSGFGGSPTTYVMIHCDHCLTLFRPCGASTTNATYTGCYSYTDATTQSGDGKIDITSAHPPLIPLWLLHRYSTVLTSTTSADTGENAYDIMGNTVPTTNTTPGAIQYQTGEYMDRQRTASSDRGLTDMVVPSSGTGGYVHRHVTIGSGVR